MILPVDITLEQLREMTKTQIINKLSTWLTNNFTKRQLVLWLLGADVIFDNPIIIYGGNGQITSQTEIERDGETGLQTKKIVTTWTYYASGEVDIITIKNYDASNVLLNTTTIKHYKDNRQPTVTVT